MKSLVVKRSVIIENRYTSVSVEEEFWQALREIARSRRVTLSQLLGSIDADRQFANLSSAIRLFVLRFLREQQAEQRTKLEAAEKRRQPWEERQITQDQRLTLENHTPTKEAPRAGGIIAI